MGESITCSAARGEIDYRSLRRWLARWSLDWFWPSTGATRYITLPLVRKSWSVSLPPNTRIFQVSEKPVISFRTPRADCRFCSPRGPAGSSRGGRRAVLLPADGSVPWGRDLAASARGPLRRQRMAPPLEGRRELRCGNAERVSVGRVMPTESFAAPNGRANLDAPDAGSSQRWQWEAYGLVQPFFEDLRAFGVNDICYKVRYCRNVSTLCDESPLVFWVLLHATSSCLGWVGVQIHLCVWWWNFLLWMWQKAGGWELFLCFLHL